MPVQIKLVSINNITFLVENMHGKGCGNRRNIRQKIIYKGGYLILIYDHS
jgi:hypothetical protein